MKYKKLVAGMLLLAGSQMAQAEQIGSVDTVFKFLGPDHKIVVEAFDDPDVQNVTCYISRAKTGELKAG
jgi:CreA protein